MRAFAQQAAAETAPAVQRPEIQRIRLGRARKKWWINCIQRRRLGIQIGECSWLGKQGRWPSLSATETGANEGERVE